MGLRALLKQQLAQLTRSTQKRQRRFLRIWDQRPISNASSALGLRRCKAFVVPFVKFVPAVRAIPFWCLPLYVTICGRGARNPSSVLRFFPGLTSPSPQFLSPCFDLWSACVEHALISKILGLDAVVSGEECESGLQMAPQA